MAIPLIAKVRLNSRTASDGDQHVEQHAAQKIYPRPIDTQLYGAHGAALSEPVILKTSSRIIISMLYIWVR
jgi:hypothetical protein